MGILYTHLSGMYGPMRSFGFKVTELTFKGRITFFNLSQALILYLYACKFEDLFCFASGILELEVIREH